MKKNPRPVIHQNDIIAALRSGVCGPGDTLLVHSSLSALGHIEGGADTVIDAFLEALRPGGTLAMPAFTYSTVHAEPPFIPYDPRTTPVRVGRIADTFWRRPGVLRSRHPSHGLAALGPRAAWLVEDNELYSPYDRRGAFGKLYDLDAKVVMFGCGLAPNSTFHALEDWAGLPSMAPDRYLVLDDEGHERVVEYAKEPMGHREFFDSPAVVSKIERICRERGILREVPLGAGSLLVMRSREIMDTGLEAVARDPGVLFP